MARYTDELDAVRASAQALRRKIALALAAEAGRSAGEPGEAGLEAADAAIAAWEDGGDEAVDPHAFRPLTPLQALLAEHQAVTERIAEMLDRRLS